MVWSRLVAVLAIAGLCLGACGDDSIVDSNPSLPLLEQQIKALIGDAPCTGDDDCRFVAFGSKPCGGPWRYLVYSKSNLDTLKLASMVKRYYELEDAYNRKSGIVSDCAVPSPPLPGCINGRCVDLNTTSP